MMIFFQKPERKRSERLSKYPVGSHGSITEMGLQHKIIDKTFFCMSRNSRIGVFLSFGVTTEVLGLVSLVSTIMLLIKIGFPLQAAILLLLSVRIGYEKYLFTQIYSVHWGHDLLPANPGSQGLRS